MYVKIIHTITKYVHIKSTTCPSSELGLPPTPHLQASVPPPPCFWGEGNTRWRERGWESPNSDEGHPLWYSLYVRTLCIQYVLSCTVQCISSAFIYQRDVRLSMQRCKGHNSIYCYCYPRNNLKVI
jgi:hypothetical protein